MKLGFRKKSLRRPPSVSSSVGSSDARPPQPRNVFQVVVPNGVNPGEVFTVDTGSRIVRVQCPTDAGPGRVLSISIPTEDQPVPPTSDNVRRINDPNQSGPPAYMVTIPPHVRVGEQFPVTIQGQELNVTCPPHARPGMSVRIFPPPPPSAEARQHHEQRALAPAAPELAPPEPAEDDIQQFEVNVPQGVQPGQPFALLAGGQRVLVTCPRDARPGQRIRFEVPTALLNRPDPASEAAKIRIPYEKDGWMRQIRLADLKFQWVRMDDRGEVDVNTRFDVDRSAYVRKLDISPDYTGTLRLVPATDAVVDSKVSGSDGRVLVNYTDIANAQVRAFEDKQVWFKKVCKKLSIPWSRGHVRITVRRDYLLGDSVNAIMSLSRREFRKSWRFEFIGEAGIDAGGLAREWFQLVTEQLFDPDRGFWITNSENQMCMHINPASELCCEDHLMYFRALGRIMGKALFDQQLVSGHMAQHLYKHILGWPVTFSDLERVNEEYYKSLKQLVDLAKSEEDLSMLCLTFSTTEDILGTKEELDLVPGGKDMDVTNDNYPEYLEACLKYRMLDRVKPQLNEMLLGFFDVIPEPLLTIFDFQEFELLMCGLPEIDIDDWRRHTEYSGTFQNGNNDVCEWFWDVVCELDQEMKARLLQFVTGTSGVPARGFAVLQGNDGNIRKFTIHGVPPEACLYPRAHTCFNRIDLPMYPSKDELRENLKLAVTMAATGFEIE